jgi:hypothetical protein
MEVKDLVDLLSQVLAVAGSGWLGIFTSGLLIVFFLVFWIFLKNLAAEKAFKESKEKELQDQINNREENAKIEEGWNQAEQVIEENKSADSKEKKKRTWLS